MFIVVYNIQRDITLKIYIQELLFLRSARRLMFVKISMKFHEDILNGLVLSPKFVATPENTFALPKE